MKRRRRRRRRRIASSWASTTFASISKPFFSGLHHYWVLQPLSLSLSLPHTYTLAVFLLSWFELKLKEVVVLGLSTTICKKAQNTHQNKQNIK
jgi:hypothetical protein